MTSIARDIASDLMDTLLSFRFEFRKHLRRRRLMIAIGLSILISMIFYAIPKIWDTGFASTPSEFANSNLGFITLLIIISGAIFAGDAVSSEFEKKTGLLLFPTPQRRTSIFIGKYLAAIVPVLTVVSIYYLITVLEIMEVYGISEVPAELFQSYTISLLYSTSVVSVIFFFSSFMKSSISSSLVGFFLMMMILPITSRVLQLVDIEPWFIVTYSAGLITSVLGHAVEMHGPGGDTVVTPDFYLGIAVMVFYTLLFFIAGLMISTRRRME